MSATVQNLGISSDGAISMDAERSQQFHQVMGRIVRHVQSLQIAANTFPLAEIGSGEMDAKTTVQAFCRPLMEEIDFVYLMLENEEPQKEGATNG